MRYLPGEKLWRIRTRMGVLVVRMEAGHVGEGARERPAPGPAHLGVASLLEDLLWEVENRNPEALALVAALEGLGAGPPSPSFAGPATTPNAVTRALARQRLAAAVARAELHLEPVEVPFLPFQPVPEEPAQEPEPAEEPSFIDLVIVDPDGKAVKNCKVRVELPDGQVQEAWINGDGRLRVDGFTQDGSASVRFLEIGNVPGRSA